MKLTKYEGMTTAGVIFLSVMIAINITLLIMAIGITIGSIFKERPNMLHVGDCVRELGQKNIEKITVKVSSGSIETCEPNENEPGSCYLYKYDTEQQKNLIKVPCE